MVDNLNTEKLTEPFFPGKFSFAKMLTKTVPECPQNRFFWNFLKNFVMLVLIGNNLK